ncbi:MAG TPA: uroporphyrinogen-III synthase [Acetobacteraceae bacterium]|jgi:uroporphyrinogen-III synthase|nr:uroporphyrinogen-III synthase [Acetobacteraceae bacterium]
MLSPSELPIQPRTRKVLITRPEPGASDTATRVAALGFEPVLSPALQVQAITASLPPVSTVTAALVTSGNAVDALPREWHATPLLTVGDATAARAQAAGFPDVRSASGDADALAALAAREIPAGAGALLLASGRGQGQALAATLRRSGHRVIRRVVYAALPARELTPDAIAALRAGQVHAVLFFSAETARQFIRLARRAGLVPFLGSVDAISIGQPVAVALEAVSWRDIRVAARPNQNEMLALLR